MKAALIDFNYGLSPRLLGCYGNPAAQTPACDLFAAQAVLFDHCYGTRIQSLPAVESSERSRQTRWSEQLKIQNVQRLHFTVTCAEQDLQNSLQKIAQSSFVTSEQNSLLIIDVDSPDPSADITQIDQIIGKLVVMLNKQVPDLLLVLRGGTQNRQFAGEAEFRETAINLLHEEQIHLPLVVQHPTAEMGQRCLQHVAAGDIYPTLLEWFGVGDTEYDQKEECLLSLLPALQGDEPSPPRAHLIIRCEEEHCLGIRDEQFYLIRRPNQEDPTEPLIELYLKPEDRWEIHNVAAQYPDVVTELLAKL